MQIFFGSPVSSFLRTGNHRMEISSSVKWVLHLLENTRTSLESCPYICLLFIVHEFSPTLSHVEAIPYHQTHSSPISFVIRKIPLLNWMYNSLTYSLFTWNSTWSMTNLKSLRSRLEIRPWHIIEVGVASRDSRFLRKGTLWEKYSHSLWAWKGGRAVCLWHHILDGFRPTRDNAESRVSDSLGLKFCCLMAGSGVTNEC